MTSPNASMATIAVPASGENHIDALSGGVRWGGVEPGATVAYSFAYANGPAFWAPDYSPKNEPDTGSGFSIAHQDATRLALQKWADIANLSFVETMESSTTVGDIRLAYTATPDIAPWWGWAGRPAANWPAGGDVWVNAQQAGDDWSTGTNAFSSLMHELGHALGLKHPFGGTAALPVDQDSTQYTLMSYTEHPHALFREVIDHGGGSYSWTYGPVAPQTPMLYDIAAIQYLYGANTNYRSGNDIYSFAPDSPFFMTIWDAGGNDTLSVLAFTKGCRIDLGAGCFSDIVIESDPLPFLSSGPVPTYDGTNNLAIAFGVTIENAIGGSGDDSLIGNTANNRLDGGGGNDTLNGAAGDDTLVGGLGADTLNGGSGYDTLDYSAMSGPVVAELWRGTVLNDGSGSVDTFTIIENLIGGSNADLLSGDVRANRIEGGAGNDRIFGQEGNDMLDGGAGNDTLLGGLGGDTLNGGSGSDTLDYSAMTGTVVAELWRGTVLNDGSGSVDTFSSIENLIGGSNADVLSGDVQANRVEGGAGNDRIFGQEGNDTLDGGAGNDTLIGGMGADTLNGGSGSDTLDYSAMSGTVVAELWRGTALNDGSGSVDTFTSIENLIGGSNADILSGDFQANRVEGGAGNDRIFGQEGNDTLVGGLGNDTLDGGAGNDTLIGGLGADTFNGGSGSDALDYSAMSGTVVAELWRGTVLNDGSGSVDTFSSIENLIGGSNADVLSGDFQANRVEGGAGNDRLFGQEGNDTLVGGLGADILNGGAGNDTLDYSAMGGPVVAELWRGSVLNDGSGAVDSFSSIENLIGGSNADILSGDFQANRVEGGAGNDRLFGQEGNDTLVGGLGADTLNGGSGSDTLDYSAMNGAVVAELWRGTVLNDGSGSVDSFSSIEHLIGGTNADALSGDFQANRVEGGAGNDRLFGQEGNDTLVGGLGSDSLYGGAGSDSFDFDALLDSLVGAGRDVVFDFNAAQGDRIDLSTIDANTLLAADQEFSFIGASAFSSSAGELRFAGGLVSGDVNGDGTADFEIQLVGVASLASGDFVL